MEVTSAMSHGDRDSLSEEGPRVDARLTTRVPADGVDPTPEPAGAFRHREATFDLVILGDFSGRGLRAEGPAESSWRAHRVTPDNAPELTGLRPAIELRLGGGDGGAAIFEAARLDDFNPDVLFRTHPLFAEIREAHAAAREGRDPGLGDLGILEGSGDPASAAQAEDAVEETAAAPAEETGAPAPGPDDDDLLDRIVAREEPAPTREVGPGADADLRAFVRDIVRPHLVRAAPDRSAEIAALERAASELMRSILRAPAFRATESLWRALGFLLSRIDTTRKVRVYLVDVSRAALARSLAEHGDEAPRDSELGRLLAHPDRDGGPARWSLAVGAYDVTPSDIPLLRAIGRCARAADVPWLGGAAPELTTLFGGDEVEGTDTAAALEEWRALRETPGAAWLVLVAPRFLAREPWGSEFARPCRAFPFHEEPADPAEDKPTSAGSRPLLWGNPAFLAAAALARAFTRDGRALSPERAADLGQVPIAPPDPGARLPRLTEGRLDPSDASRLEGFGLTTVVAFPAEARLRVSGIRSLSSASRGIQAWWMRRA